MHFIHDLASYMYEMRSTNNYVFMHAIINYDSNTLYKYALGVPCFGWQILLYEQV